MKEYFSGTGRRKTAIAQVRLQPGNGKVVLVDKKGPINPLVEAVSEPLKLLSVEKKYDLSIKLSGGGIQARLEAARLGTCRALEKVDESFAKALHKEGFLTRDPREKERKKPGLKRARRAPQWQKR